MAFDKVDRLAGEEIGAVDVAGFDHAVTSEFRMVVVDERARHGRAEGFVENSARVGHRSSAVPFADEGGAVAGRAEDAGVERLGDGDAAAVVDEAEALAVDAAEDAGAGGTAERSGGVAGGEAHAGLRQAVDVGSFDGALVQAAHVAPAEVVDHHDDDVGRSRGGGDAGGAEQGERGDDENWA